MRVLVNVSISDFGFDKIGDVLAISQEDVPVQKSKKGEFIANETSLATLKWSGFPPNRSGRIISQFMV